MTICMILHKSTICQRNLTPVLTEVTIFWLKATAEAKRVDFERQQVSQPKICSANAAYDR